MSRAISKKRKPAAGHTPFPWVAAESYDNDGGLLGVDIGNIDLDRCVAHVAAAPNSWPSPSRQRS